MLGAINSRDVLAHPIITVRAFGWAVLLKALFASRGKTFLSLLPYGLQKPEHLSLAGCVDQCIGLELRAKNVYTVLAAEYADREAARRFFEDLADAEQDHADLLALCYAAAKRSGWNTAADTSWLNDIASLDDAMQAIEASLHEPRCLHDSLRLVIEIESAEINHLFERIVSACDSVFVKRFSVFQTAMDDHLTFITEQIPKLDSALCTAVQCLRESSSAQEIMPATAG